MEFLENDEWCLDSKLIEILRRVPISFIINVDIVIEIIRLLLEMGQQSCIKNDEIPV